MIEPISNAFPSQVLLVKNYFLKKLYLCFMYLSVSLYPNNHCKGSPHKDVLE